LITFSLQRFKQALKGKAEKLLYKTTHRKCGREVGFDKVTSDTNVIIFNCELRIANCEFPKIPIHD